MLDGQQRDKSLQWQCDKKSLIVSNEIKSLPATFGIESDQQVVICLMVSIGQKAYQ